MKRKVLLLILPCRSAASGGKLAPPHDRGGAGLYPQAARRDAFFRTSWIPDETFFQTIVRHLVPDHQINTRTLTFLMFTDYGMPVTFYNDHYDLLLSQDYLFARKISTDAKDLKERLGNFTRPRRCAWCVERGADAVQVSQRQGPDGRRFAPRFWETESSAGPRPHADDGDLQEMACRQATGRTGAAGDKPAGGGLSVQRGLDPAARSWAASRPRWKSAQGIGGP